MQTTIILGLMVSCFAQINAKAYIGVAFLTFDSFILHFGLTWVQSSIRPFVSMVFILDPRLFGFYFDLSLVVPITMWPLFWPFIMQSNPIFSLSKSLLIPLVVFRQVGFLPGFKLRCPCQAQMGCPSQPSCNLKNNELFQVFIKIK